MSRIPVNPIKAPEDAPQVIKELVRQLNAELAKIRAELSKLEARVTALEP